MMITMQRRTVGFTRILGAMLFIIRAAHADFSISTNQQHVPSTAEMYSHFASCTNDAQCLNGGTCTPTSSFNNNSNTEYTRACACPSGYGGSHCQDHCPLQCQNGGYCQLVDARDPTRYGGRSNSYGSSSSSNLEARYDTGYTGSGGGGSSRSSTASAGSYQCKCRGLYAGKLCNVPYQNCPESRKCYNGGSCVVASSEATPEKYCDCPDGFTGSSCDQRSDGLGASQGASTSDALDQKQAGRTAGIVVAVLIAITLFAIVAVVVRRRRYRRRKRSAQLPYRSVLSKDAETNLRPHPEYWESEGMPHSAMSLSRTAEREKDPLRTTDPMSGNDGGGGGGDDEGSSAGMTDDHPEAKHRWRNIV